MRGNEQPTGREDPPPGLGGETLEVQHPAKQEGSSWAASSTFSSATGNTRRFVEKLGLPAARIPLLPKDEPLRVTDEYVLIVPTYGGGNLKGAVPKQVIRFLNDPDNRVLCRGVISSGNTNFGKAYCIAGGHYRGQAGGPPHV